MRDSKYMRMQWPVNDKPLNIFETLELLFPISKKEFVLVLFQFGKTIILNFLLRSKIYHFCFLLICKMYCCFVPKLIVRPFAKCIVSFQNESFVRALARHYAVFIYTYYLTNVIIFNKRYFQIKQQTICNVCSIIPEAWTFILSCCHCYVPM